MKISLVGLSQRTAPVALRERLATALQGPDGAGSDDQGGVLQGRCFQESACLSTCNRLEVYAVPREADGSARDVIVSRLAEAAGITEAELEPHIYHKADEEAVHHLLRVACGLDSQMLGETQILGQVSQAFALARFGGTCGPLLTYVFSRAAHAGKKARSETGISAGNTSISHAAVDLLEKELGDLSAHDVLVVGAGETAELVVLALHKHGARAVCCVNRTLTSAQALAERFACTARPWGELAAALADADAVITATGSPHAVIYADDVAPVLAGRQGVPLIFVDIAVPRDIDLGVGALPNVALHDIDRLEAALDHNRNRRYAAVPDVEEIVAQETRVVMEWLHAREAAELVARLREHASAVAEAELNAALRKLGCVDKETEEIIARMANRIVGKLLHEPTKQLKALAPLPDFDANCRAVTDLFGLNDESSRKTPRAAGGGGKR